MADFMQGRWSSSKELPYQITEFFLAKEFGWTLEYVRSLRINDYNILSRLLELYYAIESKKPKTPLV